MTPRHLIKAVNLGLRRRPRTRILDYPWPFPISIEEGQVIRNVLREAPARKNAKDDAFLHPRVKILHLR